MSCSSHLTDETAYKCKPVAAKCQFKALKFGESASGTLWKVKKVWIICEQKECCVQNERDFQGLAGRKKVDLFFSDRQESRFHKQVRYLLWNHHIERAVGPCYNKNRMIPDFGEDVGDVTVCCRKGQPLKMGEGVCI